MSDISRRCPACGDTFAARYARCPDCGEAVSQDAILRDIRDELRRLNDRADGGEPEFTAHENGGDDGE